MKRPFVIIGRAALWVAGKLAICIVAAFFTFICVKDLFDMTQHEPFFQRDPPVDAVIVVNEYSGDKTCYIVQDKIVDNSWALGVVWWAPSWFPINLHVPHQIYKTPYMRRIDVARFPVGTDIDELKQQARLFGVWYPDGCFINP